MHLHFEVDLSEFRRLRDKTLDALAGGTEAAVKDGLRHGVDFARANHPHQNRTKRLIGRNGELFFRIERAGSQGTEGFLVNSTPYARFIEYGTRGHGPASASVMRFVVGGQTVYAKWVKGIRPMPFMEPAAVEAGRAIERALLIETLPKLANMWK